MVSQIQDARSASEHREMGMYTSGRWVWAGGLGVMEGAHEGMGCGVDGGAKGKM